MASLDGGIDVDGAFTVADTSGNIATTGSLHVDSGATVNSLVVEDLTDNRVLIAGAGGEVEDSANLTFDGTTLTANDIHVSALTASTSAATGAFTVAGGAGIADDLWIGDDLHVGGDLSVVGGSFTADTTVSNAAFKILDDQSVAQVTLDNDGSITAKGDLTVGTGGANADTTLNGGLTVSGVSVFSGNIIANNPVFINEKLVLDDSRIDLPDGAATFTPVKPFHILRTGADGNGNTITTIAAGSTGQVLVISKDSTNAGALTLQATSNLSTANALCLSGADITLANDQDTVTLIYNGTNWSLLSHANVSAKA